MPNSLEGLIARQDIADIAKSEKLILDDDERLSVLESMKSIDVQACPGSGKTTLIAAKLILLAKKWPLQNQGICVLSHTNVAKDEIIERLEKSKTIEAQKLLSYPHFIGTIQEFVNKFLALPCIREDTGFTKFLEGDEGRREVLFSGEDLNSLCKSLYPKCGGPKKYDIEYYEVIKSFLGSMFWVSASESLAFYGDFGRLIEYKKGPKNKMYPRLQALKKCLESKGYYQYRDMYAIASQTILQNEKIASALRKRFPYVFLDEMQDTQEFQDDLLQLVFPLNNPSIIVQRFGDPDQGIFHGINGETANVSFNQKQKEEMHCVINKSHRFDNDIAKKIEKLSFNAVILDSELDCEALKVKKDCHSSDGAFKHTIFVYDDNTKQQVIHAFANLVSQEFSDQYKRRNDDGKFVVKVVGAVGKKVDSNPDKVQLKIAHYWPAFKNSRSKRSFKETTLIEAVSYCRKSANIDWAASYKILTNCILKILKMAGKNNAVRIDDKNEERPFNANTLMIFLKEKGKWHNYRKAIHTLLYEQEKLDGDRWGKVQSWLKRIFEIDNLSVELQKYLAFQEIEAIDCKDKDAGNQDNDALTPLPDNMIRHRDGFHIELSIIHGVKGETHDATLILETKNYCFDLEAMIPYLIDELPSLEYPNVKLGESPSMAAFKPNQKFMRQFYVAMSRPRHLLCLAAHNGRIKEGQRKKLMKKGWNILQVGVKKPVEEVLDAEKTTAK